MPDQAVAARQAFAVRLRDFRKDAGLTGRELAALTGLHNTKISRIEHGQQDPSEDDIRAWCLACGVARQIPELIAAGREVEQMWAEHRREMRAGMVHIQSRSKPLYESTRLLRAYESNVVPGILQTRGYVVAALQTSARVHGLPLEDVEAAADARLSRQQARRRPGLEVVQGCLGACRKLARRFCDHGCLGVFDGVFRACGVSLLGGPGPRVAPGATRGLWCVPGGA